MKAVILCLALIATASGQSRSSTDGLLAGQNELFIGHEFSETLFSVDRNVISSYITIVEQQLLDSFMDTYSEMHMIAEEFTESFNELTIENPCVLATRNRWDIQIHRHGQKLSECLVNSLAEINYWNNHLNSLQFSTQDTTNLLQNAGVAMLSGLDEFTGTQNFHDLVNMRFLETLRIARPYLDNYEDFRSSIIDFEEEIIHQLTQCDRNLAAAFANEARDDLQRAQNCLVN